MNFQDYVIKDIAALYIKLLFSGGSQRPYCEDSQPVLWRGSHDEELRPPAKNQPGTEATVNHYVRDPINILTATSEETLNQNHPAESLLGS